MDSAETPSSSSSKQGDPRERFKPGVYWQRLQSLVVRASFKSNPPTHSAPQPPVPATQLKVRVISWNMHDSVPKGDMAELLGAIPKYAPVEAQDLTQIPCFPPGEDHPYHIIVVAGQECPTVSGIPMGIAGFKRKERDRRSRLSTSIHKFVVSEPDIPGTADSPPGGTPIMAISPSTPQSSTPSKEHHHHQPTSGWSYILEDWFCRGVGNLEGLKPVLSQGPVSREDGTSSNPGTPISGQPNTIGLSWRKEEASPTSSSRHITSTSDMGPYELLIKDRLMGIYLAIFIHRELRPFIRGSSKGTVATGLMGGRIGNKGGVGISVNVDGARLLFINAHLAAHEDHVALRLANVSRIKTELVVDTFLPSGDERELAEDVTDRFDHTFLFGDLNFRLDLSRLHADWLITQKDYVQALKFDQLRKVMECKQNFAGFQEAEINFPPTYKFDVLKTLRKPKPNRRPSMKEIVKEAFMGDHGDNLEDPNVENINKPFYGVEAGSVVSSVWTDNHSRGGTATVTEGEDEDEEDEEQEQDVDIQPSSSLGIPGLSQFLPAVWKSKKKHLLDFAKRHSVSNTAIRSSKSSPSLSPSPSTPSFAQVLPPTPTAFPLQESVEAPQATTRLSVSTNDLILTRSISTTEDSKSKAVKGLSEKKPQRSNTGRRRPTSDLSLPAGGADSAKDEEGAIYDSSSKQRVPSWCDRILWKTTVERETDNLPGSQETSKRRVSRRWSSMFGGLKSPRRNLTSPTPSNVILNDSKASANPVVDSPLSVGGLSEHEPLDSPSLTREVDSKPAVRLKGVNDGKLPKSYSQAKRKRNASCEDGQSRTGHSSPSSPVPTPSLHSTSRRVTDPPASPWNQVDFATSVPPRRWFLNFLAPRRDTAGTGIATTPETDAMQSPQNENYGRGDVVCLDYGTLDDAAMRRLEGRSDHRPIFGTYAVYI